MAVQGCRVPRAWAIVVAIAFAVAVLPVGMATRAAAAKRSGTVGFKVPRAAPYPTAVTTQPDGSIVVTGFAAWRKSYRLLLIRFLPGGKVDRSFAGGRQLLRLGRYAGAIDLARQSDGKLVVAGLIGAGGGSSKKQFDLLVARLLADGRLDPGFGAGGTVAIDLGADDAATAVDLDPGGRIVVAGATDRGYPDNANPDAEFATVRLMPDGSLDPTFGASGRVTTSFGRYSGAYAAMAASDGSVSVAGVHSPDPGGVYPGRDSLALARYTPTGAPDASFGTGGTLLEPLSATHPGGGVEDVKSLLLATEFGPDGSLFASAQSEIERRRRNLGEQAIARFSPGGAADPAFDGDGYATGGLLQQLYPTVLSPNEDGSVHAAGFGFFKHGVRGLVRVSSTGSVDRGYGRRGVARVPFAGPVGLPTAASPDEVGRLVLAGTAGGSIKRVSQDLAVTPTRIALARYTPAGELDSTFGRRASKGGKRDQRLATVARAADRGSRACSVRAAAWPTAPAALPSALRTPPPSARRCP